MKLERDGAQHFSAVLDNRTIQALRDLAAGVGIRLWQQAAVTAVSVGLAGRIAQDLVGSSVRPVRAVMFDKTPQANWMVAWHQDRTIAVTERRETKGFGPWSVKQGIVHVEPPVEVMRDMLTLRLHLDPCCVDNAPLKVALGSHHLGRLPAANVADAADRLEVLTCLAETGDVWAYRTLILHSSERSKTPSRRRVLQIDYATQDLPGGLSWLGLE